ALGHAPVERGGHERAGGGALGDQEGGVAGVGDLILDGGGAALDGEGGVAGDGGGDEFGQQRFGGAGVADEHEAAIGGERDQGTVDQGRVADEFAGEPELLVADDEGAGGLEAERPSGR